MSDYILKNDDLTIQINSIGAELCAITDHNSNKEFLWNGDPVFWKRHSPILFPIVGSLKDQSYLYKGKVYHLPQHGFARDSKFELKSKSDSEIWFQLESSDATLEVYPFLFVLEIGYRLTGRTITVMWRVINKGDGDMYFSIGGHPAFMCPLNEGEKQSDYYIGFDRNEPIHYLLVNDKCLADKKIMAEQAVMNTDDGYLSINPHLFDHDALIIENNQFQTITLADTKKRPYVTVHFDAPLFGLWSPDGKNAPFVCIEPWYGRCDNSDFNGSLEEKDWINQLDAGKQFEASYTIDIA